jgi:hypothetical protein
MDGFANSYSFTGGIPFNPTIAVGFVAGEERHSADSQAPLPRAQSKFPIPHWITSFSARLPIG